MLRNILFQLLALISNIVTQPWRQARFHTVWVVYDTVSYLNSISDPNRRESGEFVAVLAAPESAWTISGLDSKVGFRKHMSTLFERTVRRVSRKATYARI